MPRTKNERKITFLQSGRAPPWPLCDSGMLRCNKVLRYRGTMRYGAWQAAREARLRGAIGGRYNRVASTARQLDQRGRALALDQITLLLVIALAFAAGYGLRAYISYRRRHRWD